MPTEQQRAALSKLRGQAAAKIQDPQKRSDFAAKQGNVEQSGAKDSDYQRLTDEANDTMATEGQNVANNTRVIRSYKHGGNVKKTGIYKLHKGEKVVPKKKSILYGD